MDQTKAKSMWIENSVVFAGKQAKTEDYDSVFDCFLMPSLYEVLQIVGVEAQCEELDCFFSDQIDKQIMITVKAHMLSLKETAKMSAYTLLSREVYILDCISNAQKNIRGEGIPSIAL